MTTATPLGRRLASPTDVSTIKPILRKPAPQQGLKRRSNDDDEDTSFQLQSSPTKKRKTVMFNESLNVVREISSKSLDEAKAEVRKALERHAQGVNGDYDNLKAVFVPPRIKKRYGDDEESNEDEDEEGIKAEDLLVYVVALTSSAPLLGKKSSDLIKSVLQCSWLEQDDNFAKAYIQLMAALSSVQGSYLSQVLSMMVDKFSPVRGLAVPVKGFASVDAETRKQRLHLGLRYLLELFPAGGKIILNMLESKFPYTEDSKAVHMEYIDHLLRLRKDRPELDRDIMELIVTKLVKLDVEMIVDLESEDDETAQEVMKLLEGNNDEDDSDAESDFSDDEDDEQARRIKLYKSKAETMDAILDLLFSVYNPIFEDPDSPEAIEAFQDLLSDFSNVILPTFKSRHTQFLLFKFAMKSHQLMDLFIGTLFNIAFESNRQPPVKQAAVGYLASFIARGAQVTSEQVQKVSKTFLDYIDHYRASHSGCRGPDVKRYGQYYAYFQGLLYIFCFRWRDLIDRDLVPPSLDWDDVASFIGVDLPWMPWLKSRLQANIASNLNPLKCCSPVIVEEFARLSHHLRLIYIYPQIEKNKSIQLSQFFTRTYATGGALRDSGCDTDEEKWTHLEPYFPFDPFQLKGSKRWLDLSNTYMPWKPFAILNKDEGDDGDVGETDEETEADEHGSIQEDTATDDENNYD